MDIIEAFIDECCVTNDSYKVKASELFDAYKNWANETNNWEGMNNNKFAREITKRSFQRKRVTSGIYYLGIDLKTNQQYGFNK